jgi:N-acetylneuraminic acid mutarotase
MPSSRSRVVLAAALAVVAALAITALAAPFGSAAPSSAYSLLLSRTSDRAGAQPVDASVVGGDVFIFTGGTSAVRQVRFRLDDPGRTRPPRQVESFAPHDLAGTINPLDTTTLADGPHTVTADVEAADGTVEVLQATFVVRNATAASADGTIRLNAGGATQTAGAARWNGCTTAAGCGAVPRGGFAHAEPQPIAGVQAPATAALYQTRWIGGAVGPAGTTVPVGATAFSFGIPVAAGAYRVRLHFAETSKGPGQRVFDVTAEGTRRLDDLDVAAEVGRDRALVKELRVAVTDGRLDLGFVRQVDNAMVSAIEVALDQTGFAWGDRAPNPLARYEAGGAALQGKLWMFGGYVDTSVIRSTARSDVYDPVANTWQRIADLPVQMTHAPTVAAGNEIWILGGFAGNHPGPSISDVWRYDVRTNAYTRGPSLPLRRGAHAAGLVGRTLHVFGGVDRPAGVNTYIDEDEHWALDLDRLDLGWQPRAALPVARNHLGGVGLDGKVYAIGGQFGNDETNGNRAEVHRYDPATDRWTRLADLPARRGHITASVAAHQGRIWVVGGTVNGNVPARDVTVYDPSTDRWTTFPGLPGGRKTPVADVIGGELISSTGNGNAPTTNTWRATLP